MTDENAFSFLTGNPTVYIKTGDSGNKREQTFCPECGSPIYSAPTGDGPKRYGIRLGTVKQRNQISPKKHFWHKSSQPWVRDLTALPVVDKE